VEKESVILVEPGNGQTKIEADAKMGNTDVQHREADLDCRLFQLVCPLLGLPTYKLLLEG
jgi:hypothetical protein